MLLYHSVTLLLPQPQNNLMRLLLLTAILLNFGCNTEILANSPESSDSSLDTGYDQVDHIVITGGKIFTGTDDALIQNEGVWVSNGRIMAVDRQIADSIKAEAKVIELADDQTLMPGMIDLHAHYNMDLIGEGRVDETTYNRWYFWPTALRLPFRRASTIRIG